MKRCPDCGFRTEDKICPLCGVRTKEIEIPTHVHGEGESCMVSKPRYTGPDLPYPMQKPVFVPRKEKNQRSGGNKLQKIVLSVVKGILLLFLLQIVLGILTWFI